jgi:ferredoxin
MSTEIYYFSGTGNSLSVARDIAETTNGKLIPVASLVKQETISTNAEVIGIVFPVHDFKPPPIVLAFIRRLSEIDSKYLFAVGTYGVMPLNAMKTLDKEIRTCGGKLSLGFVVRMPHNAIGYRTISIDEQNKMFENWKKKLEVIAEYVRTRKKGILETRNILIHFVFSGLIFKVLPSLLPLIWHITMKGWKSLEFVSDEKCDGCGICVRICPVDNIEMIDNRPSWSNHCAMCFACLQWCPKESIQAGSITVNMKRYHHPHVKVSDIMKQKEPLNHLDV